MTNIPDDPSAFFQSIRQELDALKAENTQLHKQIDELRAETPKSVQIDAELMEALADFDTDMVLNGNQESAKKELTALLDDLESMINSLNIGTGMGLKVPEKLTEIRASLKP